VPPTLFQAMLQQGIGLPTQPQAPEQKTDDGSMVDRLLDMRNRLEARADEAAVLELSKSRDAELDTVLVKVPASEFAKWVELGAAGDASAAQ